MGVASVCNNDNMKFFPLPLSYSMGLAGVRNNDNMKFFDNKKPLAVVYFDIDYARNAKGSNYWRNRSG